VCLLQFWRVGYRIRLRDALDRGIFHFTGEAYDEF
jgi:hypothetical protein